MSETGEVRAEKVAALLPGGRAPWPGVVSAGQPWGQEWARLADAGVETVVDIRESWEPRGHDEERMVREAGLRYIRIPFGHGHIPDDTFDRVREVMREAGESEAPVVVHCASGNRVGAALLPWWALDQGLSEDEALQAAVRAGLASRSLAITALDYVRRMTTKQEAVA